MVSLRPGTLAEEGFRPRASKPEASGPGWLGQEVALSGLQSCAQRVRSSLPVLASGAARPLG